MKESNELLEITQLLNRDWVSSQTTKYVVQAAKKVEGLWYLQVQPQVQLEQQEKKNG